MESPSKKNLPSPNDDRTARSPVLRLLLVNEKGMVFESSTSFSVGCSIELGVHAQYPWRSKTPAAGPSAPKSEFITSEGIVVSCSRLPVPSGVEPVYEVTLLFPALRRQDRRKLRHLADMHSASGETPETLYAVGLGESLLGLN